MSEMNEKWSSLEETAEYLGVTKDTIRSWIKKTDIPAHKVGRLWKFKSNKIAARWSAKAVAQFSIPKLKSSGNQVLIVVLLSHHNQQSNRIDITTAYEKINTQPFF